MIAATSGGVTTKLGENLVTDYIPWIDMDYNDTHIDNERGVLSRDQIDSLLLALVKRKNLCQRKLVIFEIRN